MLLLLLRTVRLNNYFSHRKTINVSENRSIFCVVWFEVAKSSVYTVFESKINMMFRKELKLFNWNEKKKFLNSRSN